MLKGTWLTAWICRQTSQPSSRGEHDVEHHQGGLQSQGPSQAVDPVHGHQHFLAFILQVHPDHDGASMAFVDQSARGIWVLQPGATEARRITSEPPVENLVQHMIWAFEPVWEPGGKGVAFRANRDGSHSVWRADLAGGAEQLLLDGRTYGDVFSLYRRNGSLYAVTHRGVFAVPARAGESPHQIIAGSNWSLDGRHERAAQIRPDAVRSTILVRSVKTVEETVIPVPDGYDVVSMALTWSPSGKAFALYLRDKSQPRSLVIATFRERGQWTAELKAPPHDNLMFTLPGAPQWIDEEHALVNTIRRDVVNDAPNAEPQGWITKL